MGVHLRGGGTELPVHITTNIILILMVCTDICNVYTFGVKGLEVRTCTRELMCMCT